MKTATKHATHGISQFELSKKILNNLSQFNLKPITKLVLLYLCDCYNPKKAEMFPKQSTIADKLGVSEASVIRAISELHREGLIVSERKYTNKYKFTPKIVCETPQNNFLCKKQMQVKNSQNEILETCKMQLHEHEQTKELNKRTNINDYKVLREYAISRGAKNIPAYINALVKSGASKQIIKEFKQKEANRKAMLQSVCDNKNNLEYAKEHRISEKAFNEISQRMRKIFEERGIKRQ